MGEQQKLVNVVFGDNKPDDMTDEERQALEDMIADGFKDFDYDLSGIGQIKIIINQPEN